MRVAHRYATGNQAISHGTAVEPETLSNLLQRLPGLVAAHHLRDLVGCRRGIADSYASLTEQVGESDSANAKLRCEVPELGPLRVASLSRGKLPLAQLDNLVRLAAPARRAPVRAAPNLPDDHQRTSEPRGKFRKQSS